MEITRGREEEKAVRWRWLENNQNISGPKLFAHSHLKIFKFNLSEFYPFLSRANHVVYSMVGEGCQKFNFCTILSSCSRAPAEAEAAV